MQKVESGISDFNSHAHVERDDMVVATNIETINFNSHAHVERDDITARPSSTSQISTHTLTWSVTCGVLPPL